MTNQEKSNWFKQRIYIVVGFGGILAAVLWINGKFNYIENKLSQIETVLIVEGLYTKDALSTVKQQDHE